MNGHLPRALMLSPVIPAATGNGLAMRSAATLRGLAAHYRVTLVVLPMYPSPGARPWQPTVRQLCEEVVVASRQAVAAFARDPDAQVIRAELEDGIRGTFDTLHAFRLATVPVARILSRRAASLHVDLDDVESHSRPGIAAMLREQGRTAEAIAEERAGREAEAIEVAVQLEFDRVYVGSPLDESRLPICGPADVRVMPNIVDIPSVDELAVTPSSPSTLLFVGTLGYFPNDDGLVSFMRDVMPRMSSGSAGHPRLLVAGSGRLSIASSPTPSNVIVAGAVESVWPLYAQAGAVIVPIRCGGGTRIKLLEAFAHRKPVVTTSIGAEGVAVESGTHAIVADDPADFAAGCQRALNDRDLAAHLTHHAFTLVRTDHSIAAVVHALEP